MAYASLSIEGGLFPADLLDRIALGEVEGQSPTDFNLERSARLGDTIERTFAEVADYWRAFQHRQARSFDSSVSLTREVFSVPMLQSLDYQLSFQRAATPLGRDSYLISHRAGKGVEAPPVHLVGFDQALDRRAEGMRRSPHAGMQEYLNRSDLVWGVLSNGQNLRLVRASAKLAGPTYLDFDLNTMFEGNHYNEFVLLYRLLHRSRLPELADKAPECWLEKYYQKGLEQGDRVREHLREGVEEALALLGNAFLAHPESEELRQRLRDDRLSATEYYRQLLRLVYRLLFLFVAEERKLIYPPRPEHATPEQLARLARQPLYTAHYSAGRLRERCERYFAGDRHSDLWQGLVRTFHLFRDDGSAAQLGMAALDGELFGPDACRDLETAGCENVALLRAVLHLSTFKEKGVRRRVNYAGLDTEELGSVYESLLDFHPYLSLQGEARFTLGGGGERKQTGSYYTPPALVQQLIGSALEPVLAERLAQGRTAEEKKAQLLALRVCDPAAGSGHFLLAAARRLGHELAGLCAGQEEPTPAQYRKAVRQVIRTCIYAVDKNQLAVDLCKVALWLEGHEPGTSLAFLDHHVKCGDSLVGVFDHAAVVAGIPDAAYRPLEGDDKQAAATFKRENAAERAGQTQLRGPNPAETNDLAADFSVLAGLDDRTAKDVQAKADLLADLQTGRAYLAREAAYNLWTAAFFAPLQRVPDGQAEVVPTTAAVRQALAGRTDQAARAIGAASALAERHSFFHWPLAFPNVFAQGGGFDVVLGNPPWERIKLQEQEFFAGRDHAIAQAPNKAARQQLIERLPERDPDLALAFLAAKREADGQSKFVHASGRFPLTAVGDVNLYALFAELSRRLLNERGRTGLILPTGIATDNSTKDYFADLTSKSNLVSFFDFENRQGLFPAVDSRIKFSLLTAAARPQRQAGFAFFLHKTEQLQDERRRFQLAAEDFALINPNTGTCPIFRTKEDAELTRAIYRRVPVLIDERSGANPWGVSFLRMFDMSNDSQLFHAQPGPGRLPLYEAKLFHQYNHRWATYDGKKVRDTTPQELVDPNFTVQPRYWVKQEEVEARLGAPAQWLISFRRIARATDERTLISAIVPAVGAGDPAMVIRIPNHHPTEVCCLIGGFNSLSCDYVVRQKVGGTDLRNHYFRQFPILPPSAFERTDQDFVTQRVLELTYTARDLQPFAHDLGYKCPAFVWDEERRALLRAELDAWYASLYGLNRDELRYILDPSDLYGPDYPGETFRVLKDREMKQYGEYRTRRLVLEAWDRLGLAPRNRHGRYEAK